MNALSGIPEAVWAGFEEKGGVEDCSRLEAVQRAMEMGELQ